MKFIDATSDEEHAEINVVVAKLCDVGPSGSLKDVIKDDASVRVLFNSYVYIIQDIYLHI